MKRLYQPLLAMLMLVGSVAFAVELPRYEYWFDNDHDNIVSDELQDGTFKEKIPLASLDKGTHTFNFRVQDEDGNWGSIYRRQFILNVIDKDATGYEYWFDNDRTSVNPGDITGESMRLPVQLTGLTPGIHTFSLRLKDGQGMWGAPYSKLVFTTGEQSGACAYEYWLDSDYEHKNEGEMNGGSLAFQLDMTDAAKGLHCLSLRMRNNLGQWGAIHDEYFYITPTVSRVDAYEYWVDGDRSNVTSGAYTGDGQAFKVKLDGIDKKGLHTFSIRYRNVDGQWGAPMTRIFTFFESPDKAPLLGYHHWLNGRDLGYKEFDRPDTITQFFNYPLPSDLGIDRSKRKYIFDGDKVSYAMNDSIHYILQLKTEAGWAPSKSWHFAIGESHETIAREMKLPSSAKFAKPQPSEFHAVKFTTDGRKLYLRSDQDATLEIYKDGTRTDSIEAKDLRGIKEITLPQGTYFGLIHSVPKNDSNPADSITFHLMDTANKLRMPQISFADTIVTIDAMRDDALVYYTLDGTDPTTDSGTQYCEKFRLDHNATVKAFATVPGLDIEDSDIAEYKVDSYTLPNPSIGYNDLKVEMNKNTALPDVDLRYTLGGAEPTEESELYFEPIQLADDALVRARSFKEGYNPSEIIDYRYVRADHTVKAPSFSTEGDNVTIAKGDAESTIWYAVNDSVPENMKAYDGNPVLMDYNGAIYAQARREGWFPSSVTKYESKGKKLVNPVISYNDGKLSFSHERSDVSIIYTLDAAENLNAASLKENGVTYDGTPIDFVRNGSIAAMAVATKLDIIDSDIERLPIDQYKVAAPSIAYENLMVKITQSTEEGVTTHYTTDGNEPTEASDLYENPLNLAGQNVTVRARSFKEGWNPSEIIDFGYTHASYVVSKPTITMDGVTASINKTDSESSIWYAVNDSVPERMSEYTGSFTMDRSGVIYAQARKSGYFPSDIASHEVKSYKLTYMLDDAVYKEFELVPGASITPEPEPAKEGYTFSGWDNVPETMPANDVTIRGTFSVNSYKLTYLVDGEPYKELTVEFGAAITPEADPEKEGHTFIGWDSVPETMPANDVTVNGKFSVNSYKLTYMLDSEVYKTFEVEYGTAISPEPEPTKEGHTFSGWDNVPETMPAQDVTVTGSFGVNTYTLTYMLDGEVYKTSQVAYGAALTPEPDPTKEGHTFSGWQGLRQTMPAHDVTVTGTFSVNSYRLTYMVDDEVYAEYTVEFGAAITPEPDPVREGFTFSGWFGVPETMPARDVTVNGSFSNTVYKATFVIDGEPIETRLIEFGAEVTTPDAPEKEGHTFAGWQDVPETMPAHDITITGLYTVNSYTLTYMVDGKPYKELTVEYGSVITPEADPVREGETFSGWQGLPETMPAHDVTVTGSFGVNTYTLTYMLDGETYKTSQVAYGAALTAEVDPTKEGHTFSGWQGLPQTMPAHDVTVTGTFSVNSYKLTYVLDDEVYAEYTVEFGAAITPEPDPVREGFTFTGWFGVPETMPARDVTVNGSFSNTVYKATFVIDGEPIETRLIEFGAEVTTPDAPEKEGHTFAGWQDVPETMPAHDITITGSYTVNSYRLTYMVDGKPYKELTVEYGSVITPEADPVREGETFSGWQGLPETMPAHDVTVSGSFGVNTYTLTYMLDGEVYKTSQVAYGTALMPEADPTKEGHTFSGWQGLPQTMPAHDVTVIGSFSVNSYKLSYMLDDKPYKEYDVEFGAAITPEPDPVREGFTFSGWFGVPETMPARDVTVNGSFSNTKFKATFVIDGETIETRLIEFGAEVTTPDAPEKEGHTFAGWQDVPETMPAHDITITGSYTVNSYKLTYMVDGKPYKELTVEYGAAITPEEVPSKEGHTFSGWDNIPATMPAHDVTVTGTFSINSYMLTYIVDGEVYAEYTVEYGAVITPEADPTKEGFTFSGWSGVPKTMPAHDVTVTGSFGVNTYTLTYMLDGEVYKTSQVAYGAALTPEADPTKEGHTFSGWQGLPQTMPAQDVTVTGTFSVNSYRLTYMVDDEVYAEYTVEFGAAITPEPDPVREGFTFSGWFGVPETMPARDVTVNGSFSNTKFKAIFVIDGETIETRLIEFGAEIMTPEAPEKEGHTFAGWQDVPATMPAHDITITGSYTVNSYKLTYTVDGALYKELSVEYGAPITPEAMPSKEGHTFSGWDNIPATMPAHDVTVTGTFSVNSYKLTYMVDGEVYAEYTFEFGVTITPEADPTKEGFTFSGWSGVPETMPAHDVTVTGSFGVNTYTLTYMLDGVVYKTSQVAYGTAITPEHDPTKEGHTFSGWQGLPLTMPAHDVTVTGTFSVNSYKLTYMLDEKVYAEYMVEFGSAITPEPDPVREGFTFTGWVGVPKTMPARDVTVNGSFSNTKFKATFVIDGVSIETRLIEFGAEVTTPDAPEKEGHTFAGWQDVPETMPAHDITIIGSYTVNSYKLTYMVDGERFKEMTVEYGTAITPEAGPSKEGYTFSGWDNVPETMPAHDVTVTGTFSVNSYRLTYMLDGEVYAEYMVEFGSSITPEPDPVREGFTFTGWIGVPKTMPAKDVTVNGSFSNTMFKATFVIDGVTIETRLIEFGAEVTTPEAPEKEGHTFGGWQDVPKTMPAHDITIIGSYTVNTYTLTYMLDGEVYKTIEVEFGAAITPEADPVREGETFSGWQGLPETMPAHDVTVTGSFGVNTYTLTYMLDGEVYKTSQVAYGAALTPEANPTKEGHTFSGWQGLPETMPAHDVTVTGTFSVNSYKLTYMIDRVIYKELTVEYGSAITPEPDPIREGETFSGWVGLPQTMPAKDVTVYGSFSNTVFKATFVIDGVFIETRLIEFGAEVTTPDAPEKEGHTFAGWQDVPETMPAHDITIIGSYTVNSYKLTYMVDGERFKDMTVEYGAAITPEAEPTKEGYTFSGWDNVPETMPAHDVTVTGSFGVNTYTLTYMLDGEVYKTSQVAYGAALTPEADPTKEGHTFSGWQNLPQTMPAHDVTVTGTFSVNSYRLTYMVDDEVYAEYTVEFGTAITPEPDPVREGFTFSGWVGVPKTMPAMDVTVNGSFSNTKFKATFVIDGETIETRLIEFGAEVTTPDAPEKEGHTFAGWQDVPDTMPAHDITITGSYSVNSYTLTYMVDGELFKELTVEYGAAITPEPEPEKEGHTFSGWDNIPETMPAHDVTVNGSFIEKPYSAKPQISYDGRFVTISCTDREAEILFTIDDEDMTKAEAYGGRFDAMGFHSVRAKTTREGFNDSETAVLDIKAYSDEEHAEIAEEGRLAEAFGWMDSAAFAAIDSYAFGGPLGADDYAVIRGMKNMLNLNLTEVTSWEIPDEALKGLDLLTLHFPKATEAYGDSIIDGNVSLCAIFANSPTEIPAAAFGSYSNPNLLVYASEAYIDAKTPTVGWIRNVIADGEDPHIDVLTLTDEGGWFSCPKKFTAAEARFVKSFSKQTVIGKPQGWETISLPYDVNEILKGDQKLIPFSAYEGSDEYKPFWLYAPTGGSWEKASSIDANEPYLISMPNCPEYDDSFNITGDVTFIGRDRTIEVTPCLEGIGFNVDSQIWPNFSSISSKEGLGVVNDTEVDGYAPGGAFIPREHDVRPFECYVTSASGRRAIPIFDSSDVEVLMDFAMELWSERYDILIRSPYPATLRLYDLNGQLVRIVKAEAGVVTRVADLTPGIYFIGNRKVLVK